MRNGEKLTWIGCLCAEWCSSCRAYRAVFDDVAREAGAGVRFVWVDIEDQPEVLGELDIETFPTLLIAGDSGVAFFGPVAPHAATLRGLVERARERRLGHVRDPVAEGIAARVIAASRD